MHRGIEIGVYDLEGNLLRKYPSLSECARAYGTSYCGVKYWIRSGLVRGDSETFGYINPKDKAKDERYRPKKRERFCENEELDRERYKILRYEVTSDRRCITPCPYMCSPKPMVGSAACQACSSFHGRNRHTHEVACGRKYH